MFYTVVLLLALLCFYDYLRKKSQNDMMSAIQTVKEFPVIGSILELSSFNADNLASKFSSYRLIYGKAYKCWIGPYYVLTTSDPQHVQTILSSTHHTRKHMLYHLLGEWLGCGLLLSNGPKWKNRRKIITPTFHFKILEQFLEVFNEQSLVLIEKLKPYADGKTVIDVYPIICLTTLDIIAETAMGTKIGAQNNANIRYVNAVRDVTDILAMRFMHPHFAFKKIFKFFKPKIYNKQLEGVLYMHLYTNRIIEQRRQALKEESEREENESKHSVTDDFESVKKRMALLDLLLQATTCDGKPLSNDDIREEVDTFMFKGHDTTASAISFALRAIASHPNVQMELYKEIRHNLGDNLMQPITYEQIQNLKYLNCVVKEALRLYPPIPAIGRYISEDLPLYNGTIPSGTNVNIILWELLRDDDVFPDPLAFTPERHLDEQSNLQGFSYIPFSAGPRNCIGQKFALLEIKCVLVKILQHYQLLPLGEDVQPSIKIVLRSKTGVNLGLRRRPPYRKFK